MLNECSQCIYEADDKNTLKIHVRMWHECTNCKKTMHRDISMCICSQYIRKYNMNVTSLNLNLLGRIVSIDISLCRSGDIERIVWIGIENYWKVIVLNPYILTIISNK